MANFYSASVSVLKGDGSGAFQNAGTLSSGNGPNGFVVGDFSHGLTSWPDARFDGIVSGLAVQYAESYSEAERRWTR